MDPRITKKRLQALLRLAMGLICTVFPFIHGDEWEAAKNCYSKILLSDQWDIFAFNAALSHQEGKGIGYHQGYTTLEFFLMPSFLKDQGFYPFIDLRGHGLDNQKIAANAGIGLRYLMTPYWLAGINIYYDFRQGEHHGFDRLGYGFQEVSVGLEALGPYFDLRVNIYQPFNKATSRFFQTYFFDNRGIIPTIFYKEQFAAYGVDAEVGGWIGKGIINNTYFDWKIYLAGGPYYLHAQCCSRQWGGKIRLEIDIARYFFIKTAASYDEINRGRTQICLGVNIPLYPWTLAKPVEAYCSPFDAPYCLSWKDWVSQPVQRAEIMPLRTRRISR